MYVNSFLVCVALTFLFYLCIVIIYAIIRGIVKQLRKKRKQKLNKLYSDRFMKY